MAFCGQEHNRCKAAIDNEITEQTDNFNHIGYNISYCSKEDINSKPNIFQGICKAFQGTHKSKTLKTTQIKSYKVMAVSTSMYNWENWTLNETDRRKIETGEMKF